MKCDHCDNEATLHDVKIKGGEMSEVNLCESCAAKLGVVAQSFSTVDDLFKQSIAQQAGIHVSVQVEGAQSGGKKQANTCSSCGLTWADFREKGVFGCPDCYSTFESRIGALLERAHEGGTHHVGKCPSRLEENIDHAAHLRHLRKQLDDAITAEQYERAADLRDAIGAYSTRFGIDETDADPGSGNGEGGAGNHPSSLGGD